MSLFCRIFIGTHAAILDIGTLSHRDVHELQIDTVLGKYAPLLFHYVEFGP